MPVLHVGADPDPVPDGVLVRVAAAVAGALGIAPVDVLVRRTGTGALNGAGAAVHWSSVIVQGRDRGPAADAAVAAAIREAWPDDRLSIAVLRDLA